MIAYPTILSAYTAGYFPMASEDDAESVVWVLPAERGVLPLDEFRVPRRLRRNIRSGGFTATLNADFSAVINACADRPKTWINRAIVQSYLCLHERGFAHSIEIRQSGSIVGGLYGLAFGGAFFGESMFSAQPSASQCALVHLVNHMRATGYCLLDLQFLTPHLQRFGGRAVDNAQFNELLNRSQEFSCSLYSQPFEEDTISALQRISQIS